MTGETVQRKQEAVWLASRNKAVVFGVCADPEPDQDLFPANSQRLVSSPTIADQNRPIFLNASDGWLVSAFNSSKLRSAKRWIFSGKHR